MEIPVRARACLKFTPLFTAPGYGLYYPLANPD